MESTSSGRTYAEYLVKKMQEETKPGKSEAAEASDKGFVKWLPELTRNSIPVAGGKGANLAEMYNAGLPVPPAFVITAQAFAYFISHGLRERISAIINTINIDNTKELDEKARQIKEMVASAAMPAELEQEIIESYETLNVDRSMLENASGDALAIIKNARESVFVAVRSSATTEDLADASFAGQQETFLNIKGKHEVIDAVKKCYASLFNARAIYYRQKKGFDHDKSLIAVIVQKMINSDKSGVMFTVNPMTNNDKEIMIEAVFGLGEGIVSGTIMPDQYITDKPGLNLKEKQVSVKEIQFTRTSEGKTVTQELPPIKKSQQVISEYEIKQLASYGVKIEDHYSHPQDIEWGIESGTVYMLQTRPITTLKKGGEEKAFDTNAKMILKGLAASPGVASGPVRIVKTMDDLEKIQDGDVLVTKMTNPDMVVSMQKASAIITDEGGATAHAAIVSREMGIPAVVGTKTATTSLQDGMMVTVNGSGGVVYEGKAEIKVPEVQILPIVKTKTELKAIIDLPHFAERAARTAVQGVGLLRLEGIVASQGKHPLQYEKENNAAEYGKMIEEGLITIVKHFPHGSIWIRTSDIRTDEYQHLKGAPPIETNPMLGMHGIRFSLVHPALLKAELLAIKRVAEQGYKIGVMMPQVVSLKEVEQVRDIMKEIGLLEEVELGVMIETPAAVQIIEELCRIVDFVSFGTNDLTQYTLAIDRGNEEVQSLYDEMHPAVLSQISQVIEVCKKHGIKSSICGQAGSRRDMAAWLVRRGIGSISVNADAAHDVSVTIKEIEDEFERAQAPAVPAGEGNGNSQTINTQDAASTVLL